MRQSSPKILEHSKQSMVSQVINDFDNVKKEVPTNHVNPSKSLSKLLLHLELGSEGDDPMIWQRRPGKQSPERGSPLLFMHSDV